MFKVLFIVTHVGRILMSHKQARSVNMYGLWNGATVDPIAGKKGCWQCFLQLVHASRMYTPGN